MCSVAAWATRAPRKHAQVRLLRAPGQGHRPLQAASTPFFAARQPLVWFSPSVMGGDVCVWGENTGGGRVSGRPYDSSRRRQMRSPTPLAFAPAPGRPQLSVPPPLPAPSPRMPAPARPPAQQLHACTDP